MQFGSAISSQMYRNGLVSEALIEPEALEAFQAERAAAVAAAAAAAAAALDLANKKDAAISAAGIDLNQLNGDLANAVRNAVTIKADGTADFGGLRFNGLGGDVAARINQARSDLPSLIANNGMSYVSNPEAGTEVFIPLYDAVTTAGGGGYAYYDVGVLRRGADANTALSTLNTLSNYAAQMPSAPSYLTANEAKVFDRLVSETGDGNWVKLKEADLKGVLYALKLGNDGKLDMSRVFGGALGFDGGVPDAKYATSRELRVDYETGGYFYIEETGYEQWSAVQFAVPDPSVGSIVMETRDGGGDNGSWTVPVYRPTDATAAKYAADLAKYNETYGKLTEAGAIQVRAGAGNTLNIGNDYGYLDASKMQYSRAFGLIASTSNVKYPDSGGGWFDDLMDAIGDVVEVVVPIVISAVFSYFGGPIGSFVASYVMSDGDLDKALLAAVGTYVTSGWGAGIEGAAVDSAASSVALDTASSAVLAEGTSAALTDAALTTVTSNPNIVGLASSLGVTDQLVATAVNQGASSALQAAGSGENLEGVLAAGLTGAATGYFGAYVTAEATSALRDSFSTPMEWYSDIPISQSDALLARNLGSAIGSGTTGVVTALVNGDDVGDALLRGVTGMVGATIGSGVASEFVDPRNTALTNAVQAGTSSLVTGLVNTAVTDMPTEVAIGSALANGFNTYIRDSNPPQGRTPSGATTQATNAGATPTGNATNATQGDSWEWYDNGQPVTETTAQAPVAATPEPVPAAETVAPPVVAAPDQDIWEWYDNGMDYTPISIGQTPQTSGSEREDERPVQPVVTGAAPTAPEEATWEWNDNGEFVGPPAPVTEANDGGSVTASNDNTEATQSPDLWEWYDNGMPVETEQSEASEPTEEANPAENQVNSSGSTPAPSQARTVVVTERGRDSRLWGIARSVTPEQSQQQMHRQIGQLMVENNLETSMIRPGQPLTLNPATSANYSEEELAAFETVGRNAVNTDEASRMVREAAAAEARRARDIREAAAAAGQPASGSAPLPYTVPGAGSVGPAAPAAETKPGPGVLTSIASMLGADSLVFGGTMGPNISAPWTNPAALTMSGGHFYLVNSDGYNYFRGIPFGNPVTAGGSTSWNGPLRNGMVVTVNNEGAASAGVGGTWVIKTPNGLPDALAFFNLRAEDTPLASVRVENGVTIKEGSANIGWALNANDMSAGLLRGLSAAATLVPTPQTQTGARAATGLANLLQGAKYTTGSMWVGAAYQVRIRQNAETNEIIGVYTPQGQQISNVGDWLSTRYDRALNVFTEESRPDLIDYRLVGP